MQIFHCLKYQVAGLFALLFVPFSVFLPPKRFECVLIWLFLFHCCCLRQLETHYSPFRKNDFELKHLWNRFRNKEACKGHGGVGKIVREKCRCSQAASPFEACLSGSICNKCHEQNKSPSTRKPHKISVISQTAIVTPQIWHVRCYKRELQFHRRFFTCLLTPPDHQNDCTSLNH